MDKALLNNMKSVAPNVTSKVQRALNEGGFTQYEACFLAEMLGSILEEKPEFVVTTYGTIWGEYLTKNFKE